MACSAVVIELPNGVFIHDPTSRAQLAAGTSTLSTPIPARTDHLRFVAAEKSRVDLRRDRIARPL